MSIVPNRRAVMTLYSSSDAYSHRVRIALAEKAVTVDILDIKSEKIKEELNQLNPYGSVPTLLDRDLVVYTSEVIMEYLDERFPHPPLMPVYPIARARTRLMMYRLNRDWYSLMDKILLLGVKKTVEIKDARKELTESLTSVAPILSEMSFFLSEEFSLLDCCIAPLLWRLPLLGIELPLQAKSVLGYAERLFQRPSFVASLSEVELAMRSIKK
ncbi:MAG TPA: glutathione S-transferase N-terminal domain-containing protein [Gammaproteobacteria bacterium]|nr:glutathione S-transferase N-terminal domain-containing protein [Gammaproteobacteria bacterium]